MLSPNATLDLLPVASTANHSPRPPSDGTVRFAPAFHWAAVALIAAALVWCYWPTLATMSERWSHEPQYSHGFLVPVFALAVLMVRRPQELPACRASWWGVAVMAGATVLRYCAAELDNQTLDGLSMLAMLAGAVLLIGGWRVLAWTWPSIAFLGFMLPLPFAIEVALSHPLQRLATVISTFVLQTLGLPAFAEGNIITIDQIRLGVVEACSGLGMLMTFFALSTAMALIVRAPLGDRLVIVVSAIPIAVIANVLRITATGAAYHRFGDDSAVAQAIMHDFAGWLMMPLALSLLWLELKYLSWLLVPCDRHKPILGIAAEACVHDVIPRHAKP